MSSMDFPLYGSICGLRPVRRSDLPNFFDWYRDRRVQESLADPHWKPRVRIEDYYRLHFQRFLGSNRDERTFTIVDTAGKAIGFATCSRDSRSQDCCEIGLVIGEVRRWRHGFGLQALELLIGYLRMRTGFKEVLARVPSANSASRRLFEKAGFLPRTGRVPSGTDPLEFSFSL